jgi:hypothetical protein
MLRGAPNSPLKHDNICKGFRIAMPDWFQNILSGRALSLVVAFIYLGITLYFPHRNGTLITDLFLVSVALAFPLACIWYPDELGEYYGSLPGPAITQKSPAWMVKVGGWILLLLPAILFWFIYKS